MARRLESQTCRKMRPRQATLFPGWSSQALSCFRPRRQVSRRDWFCLASANSSLEVFMTNRVSLRAQLRELAATNVEALIGPRLYGSITVVDPSPFFVEMVVAHEGQSRGEVVGFGAQVKEWGKRVIRALAHAFNPS